MSERAPHGICYLLNAARPRSAVVRDLIESRLGDEACIDVTDESQALHHAASSQLTFVVGWFDEAEEAINSLGPWQRRFAPHVAGFAFLPDLTVVAAQQLASHGFSGFATSEDVQTFQAWLASAHARYPNTNSGETIHKRIVRAIPDVLVLMNREGVYLDIFASPESDIPFERKMVIGRRTSQVLPEPLHRQCQAASRQAFETGQVVVSEMELPGTSESRWIECRSVAISDDELLVIVRDATVSVQRREALDQNERLLRLAQQGTHAGYWEWEVDSDHFRMSSTLAQILGVEDAPPDNTLSALMERILHPHDSDRIRRRIEEALSTGVWSPVEHRVIRPSGEVRTILSLGNILPAKPDGGVSVIGMSHDISDLKNVEAALRERERELAEISKVSSIGQVAAQVAHELNQPLFAVTNFAEAVSISLEGPLEPAKLDQIRQWLASISALSRDAGDKIRRMTRLLQRSKEHAVSIDVIQMLRDSCRLLAKELLSLDINVRWRLEEGGHTVTADRITLQQLFNHLLQNALESLRGTPDGVRQLTLSVRPDPGGVLVGIEDNGGGFDPQQFDQLCQPFYSGREDALGVGLAICRTIVQNLQGRMWAERAANGIRISLLLPSATTSCDSANQLPTLD